MKISFASVQSIIGFCQCSSLLWLWTAGAPLYSGRAVWAGSLVCLAICIRCDYRIAKIRRDMGDIEAWVRREAEKRARGQ